jgi:hypothetical protein
MAEKKQQPSLWSELSAMTREAIKDVRSTVHQFYFGRAEGAGEPGAPLNPTMQEVTQSRDISGKFSEILDQYAARGSVHGREEERGQER